MKNSKEMADEVFRIRDEYAEKKRRRNALIGKTALAAVPCAVIVIAAAAILSDREEIPINNSAPALTSETAVSETSDELPVTSAEEKLSEKQTETSTVTSTVTTTMQKYETELLPESIVPEEAAEEVSDEASAAVTEMPPETRTVTTTAVPAETVPIQSEAAAEDMPTGIPDEMTEDETVTEIAADNGIEEAVPESADGLAEWTAEDIYRLFPEIELDKRYYYIGTAVSEEQLGENLFTSDIAAENSYAEVTVFSLAESAGNEQIAVSFNGGEYILYGTKDE